MKRGKRLSPVSAKRLAEKDKRDEVRAITLARAGYRCEAEKTVPEVQCGFRRPQRSQLEVHEVIPRSVYPGAHLDVRVTQALCPLHHDWVGDNPTLAAARGHHGYSWQTPPKEQL